MFSLRDTGRVQHSAWHRPKGHFGCDRPSQSLGQKGVFLSSHFSGTSKTKYNYNQVTTQKPKE